MEADQELIPAVGACIRIGELGLVVLLVGHVESSLNRPYGRNQFKY